MQEKYSLLTNASEIRGDKVLKVSPSIKSLVSFRAIAEAKIGKSQMFKYLKPFRGDFVG